MISLLPSTQPTILVNVLNTRMSRNPLNESSPNAVSIVSVAFVFTRFQEQIFDAHASFGNSGRVENGATTGVCVTTCNIKPRQVGDLGFSLKYPLFRGERDCLQFETVSRAD